ncbi:TRAP transporter large permease subunit, partial [Planktomarina temperata]|nr:TRAP transporter large permease subunit [Planktomarina temperata]MDB2455400.1 TRAP transporter large permease subunit [Planktomarina temperata]
HRFRLRQKSDASSHSSDSTISFTTPPFGLLFFVMKGVSPPETTMREIYNSAFPYIFCSLFLVILLIAFPQIALWLPAL